ncbi:DHA2 family efflux MFS transporter permease subunit [Cystobacter fuscus]|uniref:DHA2 family efflux MFS transporter permease subunit n=1 Tax=Cystobacter fuscus TaxID=43 RepID=UPI002B2BC159|nr:DHA2 family efflux MFS transporter permease subunit [Cystobacter fuscus]
MKREDAGRMVRTRWLIALSVTFGTMMGALDSSIMNVALSNVRGAVGATVQEVTWLSTAYVLATVLVMPLTGFFGRVYGQKTVYLSCLTLFVVGSALCAVAQSFAWLVVFRALQGLGAGALQPTEQAILRQTFPPEEHGMAMGVFSVAVGVGPALGPSLGGWIVDNFHWSWIFLINVPVGFAGFLMVARFVPPDERPTAEAAEQQRGNMDWLGICLLWVTLLALQFVLEEGPRYDWFESPILVVLLVTALFAGIAFVIRELTAPSPAVNLRVFRDPTFTVGSLMSAVATAILLSGTFLLPLFMQELLDYTAMHSGMAQLPRTLVMIVAMPLVGRFYNRVPPRVFVFTGVAITVLGQLMLAKLSLQSNAHQVIGALVLQGLGMSLVLVPLSTLSLSRIPREELGDAAGLAALLGQVGISTGLAVLATVLERSAVVAQASLTWQLTPERLAAVEPGQLDLAHGLATEVVRQGRLLAFQNTFMLGAVLYALLLLFVWFIRAPQAPADALKVEPPEV